MNISDTLNKDTGKIGMFQKKKADHDTIVIKQKISQTNNNVSINSDIIDCESDSKSSEIDPK